jgi:hypothetical protein
MDVLQVEELKSDLMLFIGLLKSIVLERMAMFDEFKKERIAENIQNLDMGRLELSDVHDSEKELYIINLIMGQRILLIEIELTEDDHDLPTMPLTLTRMDHYSFETEFLNNLHELTNKPLWVEMIEKKNMRLLLKMIKPKRNSTPKRSILDLFELGDFAPVRTFLEGKKKKSIKSKKCRKTKRRC